MKKLLRVIGSVDPRYGGVAQNAREVDRLLALYGFEVVVLTNDEPNCPSIHSYPCKAIGFGSLFGKFGYSATMGNWLARNITKFDAVLVDGLWQYNGLLVRKHCLANNVPYFLFPHGMLDPWFAKAHPIKHLKKLLYWLLYEKNVVNDARRVVFTCQEERLLAQHTFPGYEASELVCNLGVEGPPMNAEVAVRLFEANFPDVAGRRCLLFLGRIDSKKGCDLLLDAFAKVQSAVPGLALIFAGPDSGDLVTMLKRRANILKVSDKVIWTGMLDHSMKYAALFKCEALCLPSHQENFGMVVAEALSCQKPVIISNKVNIWREVQLDGAGIVGDDSDEGVVGMLTTWCSMSNEDRRVMAENAASCFNRRFNSTVTTRMLAESLESALP